MRTLIVALAVVLASATTTHAQRQALFDFHSVFWINLHHYLHALARPNEPLREVLPASATGEERRQWSAAVDFYRSVHGKRSLLFDEQLVQARQELAAAGSNGDLRDAKLALEHRKVLEAAAPIYRKYWWRAHDAANRQFIERVQELLTPHGMAIARRLAASFDTTWPEAPIRVDLVHDAGPPGNAYTISEPTLITIGASDPRHHGLAAMELVFHEASHRWDSVLMKDVSSVGRRLQVRPPGGLWHGLLFYNAGAITAETLAAAGVRGYVMYMVSEKTFDYPGWHEAIARHWPQFLSGTISRDQAVERILRDLP